MSRSLLMSFLLLLCSLTARAQVRPVQFASEENRKIAVPIYAFPPAQGSWRKLTNAVSSGRIYDFAVVMDTYESDLFNKESRVVFARPEGFDLLECWVGLAAREHTGQTRFLIAGDGVPIYNSPWMTWRDQTKKVSVSIKGYKAVSLIVEGYRMSKLDMAIWGEPVLIQTNSAERSETLDPLPVTMTVRRYGREGIGISIDGTDVKFGNAQPINESGRLLVPMRPIFEALGARVNYDFASRQITATRDTQTIVMTPGNKTASINGRQAELDVPSRVVSGETLVPLRFVAEALGVAVEYKR